MWELLAALGIGILIGFAIGWIVFHARYCARCREHMALEDHILASVRKKKPE